MIHEYVHGIHATKQSPDMQNIPRGPFALKRNVHRPCRQGLKIAFLVQQPGIYPTAVAGLEMQV